MHKLRCGTKFISIGPALIGDQISRGKLHISEREGCSDRVIATRISGRMAS